MFRHLQLQSNYDVPNNDELESSDDSTFSTTYQSFSSIIKTVVRTLTTLNPVSVLFIFTLLQMVLAEAQADDTLVLEAPSNGTLNNVTLVPNNLGMNATAFSFAGTNFSNITTISDYINLSASLFLNLVLDFPGNGTTYTEVIETGLISIANRFGIPNSSYLFQGDGYFYAQDYNLPSDVPQTLSWWMRNATAGSIISYGINVEINQQYLNNQSGSAYACPGENGYLSIAYDDNLVCGGWLNSPLNENLYLGYGPNNTWSQYALTLDDSNTITIYINGSALARNLTVYSEPPTRFTTPFFLIGNLFSGELDTLRVYSRPLNASEIRANFIAENTPPAVNVTASSSTGMSSSSVNPVSRSSSSSSNNVATSRQSSSTSSSVTSSVPSSSASSSVSSSDPSSSAASSSVTSNTPSSSANTNLSDSSTSSFPRAAEIAIPVVLGTALLTSLGIFAVCRRKQPLKQNANDAVPVTEISKLKA